MESRCRRYQFEKEIVDKIQKLKTDNWHSVAYLACDVFVISARTKTPFFPQMQLTNRIG